MKRLIQLITFCSFTMVYAAGPLSAATCDQYPGDTWIYGGVTSSIKPNVLVIIDTSGSMSDTVPGTATPYDSATTYPTTYKDANKACRDSGGSEVKCTSTKIYKLDSSNGRWRDSGFSLTAVTTSCNSVNPYNLLSATGQYTGRTLSSSGGCSSSGTTTYASGNWINWDKGGTSDVQKIDVARNVVSNLIASTTGVNFGVMVYNNKGSEYALSNGSTFFTYAASGSTLYTSTINDMDAIFTGSMTNREALLASVNTTTVVAKGATPLAESLYEAGQYFRGAESAFSNDIGLSGSPAKYTSPITASCQKNYIVFVTDGMSTSDDSAVLKSYTPLLNGDYDGDGVEPGDMSHSMDDVAKYLYDADLLADDATAGKEYTIDRQNVYTYTVGFGAVGSDAQAVALLQRATDSNHGHGAAYLAGDQSALSSALAQIISSILTVDISFVAPVVPVSPENRTYSSSRVYMGFFRPISQTYWEGNLKKYGIDANNNIIDRYSTDINIRYANWVDLYKDSIFPQTTLEGSDGIDDRTGEALPNGATNGTFRTSSISFWSTTADAGKVNSGGAGDLLLLRNFTTDPRKLYTFTGSNESLTNITNAFSKTNAAITTTLLGVADTATKDKLIDFMYGIDAFDENANLNVTEKRSWLFGDVLHAKPLVVNYASYTLTAANESDCSVNKSMIYVGSNDGMLHAIKDCDGSEAWAFIPPELLGNLNEIRGEIHTYTVDSSPSMYIYDANNNGTIESGDKVILMIGLRRGGGTNTSPTKGSYYLLDVTNPVAPLYKWSLSNATAGFEELGESWAEPKITRLKIGTAIKIAAFIGGGYDNMNEDNRYGATQTFSGTGTISNSTSGAGANTSSGTSAQLNPKGQALYAVEIATLSNVGVPTITTAPSKIWGVTKGAATDYTVSPATDSGMTFAVSADVASLDVDGNGYADRIYVTDLGGNLWRFDVGSSTVTSWRGYKIFSANPGSGGAADKGRKVFYKSAVTMEASITNSTRGYDSVVFMGTGDREHPTNTNVVDRIYAIRDKGQTSTKLESDLLDVTTDQLQTTTTASGVGSIADILAKLGTTTNYGWYIKLDLNAGEKVLASPTVFNKVVYLTTFTPGASINADPCKPSNLGTSRLYALNYGTGEAVMNYDQTNDSTATTNKRAQSKPGSPVLLRSDRSKTIGSGIPSAPVVVINPGGTTKLLIGCGGAICPENSLKGGGILNLYWGRK